MTCALRFIECMCHTKGTRDRRWERRLVVGCSQAASVASRCPSVVPLLTPLVVPLLAPLVVTRVVPLVVLLVGGRVSNKRPLEL